jgi:hypothetical protein
MGQFSMEKPALKGQFSVEINSLRMGDVNDLGRDDHCKPSARAQKRHRGEQKRHPSVCMLCKGKLKLVKNLFGTELERLRKVLIADKGGIADDRIEPRASVA